MSQSDTLLETEKDDKMRWTLLPATLLFPIVSFAQTAAPSVTLKVTTRMVYVDVVVRDASGRVVPGLTESNFKLSEDGHPQRIDFFTPHTYDTSAAASGRAVAAPTVAAAALKFSNVAETRHSAGAINMILLDLVNTPQSDQLYARRQLLTFLKTLPSGQQIALFVLSDRLHMIQSFTDSSDRLLAAAQQIDVKDFHLIRSSTQQMQDADLIANIFKAIGRDPGDAGTHLQTGQSAQDARDTDLRAVVTLRAFDELAHSVSGYSGRKNLFWLADTFPLAATAQFQINDLSSDARFQMADLPSARDTANLIATAQIAVYPLSLAGLETGGVGAAVSGTGESSLIGAPLPTSTHPQVGDTLESQFVVRQQMHSTMSDLARQTGGEAFYGTNDFAGALRRGIEDGSNYYTLAYRPSNQDWNGKFRGIRVSLQSKGYSLTYRRGYFAVIDTALANDTETELRTALMPDAPESTMLRLSSEVMPPRPGNSITQVNSTVDIGNLAFSNAPDGSRHATILVALLARKDAGDQAPMRQTENELHLDFTPEQYKTYLASGIQFRQQLPLSPGRYLLQIGVSDLTNHRLGTLKMPIEVSDAARPAK